MMVFSSTEMLGVVCELACRRTSMVLGKEAKRQNKPLKAYLDSLPDQVKLAISTAAALHTRYTTGDYRHEDRDEGVLLHLCNYLAELHQTAGGHPRRPVAWGNSMKAKAMLPRGLYLQVAQQIREQIG